MALGVSKRRIQKSSGSQNLNLMPIMNLFIIIIPMLLMITVSVHMAFLSLNLAASGTGVAGDGEGGSQDIRVKMIKVVIYTDSFEVQEEDFEETISIPARTAADGDIRHDYFTLDSILYDVKRRNQDVNEIRIAPYPDVFYGTLIRVIDICKGQGFQDIKYEKLLVGEL